MNLTILLLESVLNVTVFGTACFTRFNKHVQHAEHSASCVRPTVVACVTQLSVLTVTSMTARLCPAFVSSVTLL